MYLLYFPFCDVFRVANAKENTISSLRSAAQHVSCPKYFAFFGVGTISVFLSVELVEADFCQEAELVRGKQEKILGVQSPPPSPPPSQLCLLMLFNVGFTYRAVPTPQF